MPYKNKDDQKKCYQRSWLKNKEKIMEKRNANKVQVASWKRTSHLKRYGITEDEFYVLVESQGGRCAICGDVPIRVCKSIRLVNTLYVDHNHETGKVRALLCQKCNVKLAAIENKEFMLAAISYLEKYDQK